MIDLLGRLQVQSNLTNNERYLADYILQNKTQVIEMDVEELAEKSQTSVSNIYRLCRKLKVDGYSKFKVILASEINTELSKYKKVDFNIPFSKNADSLEVAQNIANVYKQTVDETLSKLNFSQLENIAKLIRNSTNIFFLTTSINVEIAETFTRRLYEIGIHIHVASELTQQRLFCSLSRKGDLAILLSYSGSSDFIQDCIQQLYRNQVSIVILSSNKNEKLYHYATIQLLICSLEHEVNKITTFSSYISAQLICDLIFSLLYQDKFEWNFKHRPRSYMMDKR